MDDEQLIECVRKYEFLYNLQHPKYMDTVKKDIAWKDISDQMKQPSLACKQRWQCLRDSYRRSLNKKRGKSGQAATKIKKWKYEDEMSFIAPFFVEKKTLDTVELPIGDNEEDPDNDNETSEIDLTGIDDISAANAVGTEGQKEENNVENYKPAKALKRVKNRTAQSAAAVLMTKLLDDQNRLPPHREPDELDRFFLNISDTVKKFSPYLQALVKNKVFSFVSDMELQQLAPVPSLPTCNYTFSNSYTPSPQSTSSIPPCATTIQTSPEISLIFLFHFDI